MEIFDLNTHRHAQRSSKRAFNTSAGTAAVDDGPLPEKRPTRVSVCQRALERCLFCQTIKYIKTQTGSRVAEPLIVCQSQQTGEAIQKAASVRTDQELLITIRGLDLVAKGIKYHKSCHKRYTDKQTLDRVRRPPQPISPHDSAFHDLKKYIKTELFEEMRVMRMAKLLIKFRQLLSDAGVECSKYRAEKLKRRMVKHYGQQLSYWHPGDRSESEMVFLTDVPKGQIVEAGMRSADSSFHEDLGDLEETVQSDHDDTASVQHAALIIRQALLAVKSTICHPLRPEDIDEDNIPVPISVYNMLACIVHADAEYQAEERVPLPPSSHRQVISISQDLIHAVSRGRVKTQKHVALPILVKNLGGGSEIITVLNRLGHSLSYTQIEEMETALAEEVAKPGLILPSNCQPEVFGTFCWDNSDLQEETLSGHGTTHCTSGIVIQQTVDTCSIGPRATPASLVDITNIQNSSNNNNRRRRSITEKPNIVMGYPTMPRTGPESLTIDVDQMTATTPENTAAQKKDMGWFLARLSTEELLFQPREDHDQSIPGWTAFNRILQENAAPRQSTIGYCQTIDASPTEVSTVYTLLKRSLIMANELHQFDCPVVCDLAIFSKMMQIIWQRPDEFSRIIPRMGSFHIIGSFLSVIGKRYGDAGLADILTESGVLAAGSVAGVIQGKHYNRAVRMHKLTFEALERLRWSEFGSWLEDHPEHKVPHKAILEILRDMHEHPCMDSFQQLIDLQEFNQLKEAYAEFDRIDNGPMKQFWSSYLNMVSLLLQFIRATREGNWSLHLACIGQIIPYMFALDNVNYARYLPVYWAQMTALPNTHPEAYRHFADGEFAVQRSKNGGFSQVAVDQTIEQTLNRTMKTKGGIVGYSLKKGAVQRWLMTSHLRAGVTDRCKEMLGMVSENPTHREATRPRLSRDEADVQSLIDVISSWCNPFKASDTLVSLASGRAADASMTRDLCEAEARGRTAMTTFVQEQLTT